MRILVVEDEVGVRELVQELLEHAGHEVTTAEDALEGMRKAVAAPLPFELLITDIVLCGPSGYDLAVNMTLRSTSTRTLFMTGYGDDSPIVQHARSRSSGITGFLRKPFTPDNLFAAIESVMAAPGPDVPFSAE